MRTLSPATASRRRAPRDRACAEPPRLWGDAPPAEAATTAAPAPAPGVAPTTLEALVLGAWEGVTAGEAVACPLCAGALRPRWSAGAGVVGGRCSDCGTDLE